MKVRITEGPYKGTIGYLSYDEDGTEWVVIGNNVNGYSMDLQVSYEVI